MHPADVARVVQAVPFCYNKLLEDKETAFHSEEDGEEASTAAGGISADMRRLTWPRQCRCSVANGIAAVLHL